ncbi:hypothetical protein PG994_004892 [Apiospora phragmitis]|uniref:Cytochrome P450 n=1 Tax=Apiospora phragmitis TaxID=2905665 RepID=A0ABR1VRX0_9PEZI
MLLKGGSSHRLPPGTKVYLSAPGVHYHPKYWPNPEAFGPHRWVDRSWTYSDHHRGPQQQQQPQPQQKRKSVASDATRHMRGMYLTFSDGARACLGRKFAQAEFMAFFATFLRQCRVELRPGTDAGEAEARPRRQGIWEAHAFTALPLTPDGKAQSLGRSLVVPDLVRQWL